MESDREIMVRMSARLVELRSLFLLAVSQGKGKKPDREWMGECVAAIGALMDQKDDVDTKFDALSALAWGMWQAGHQAALKFMLPEGAGE